MMSWCFLKASVVSVVLHLGQSKAAAFLAAIATVISAYVTEAPSNMRAAAAAAGIFILVDTVLGVAYAIQQRKVSSAGFSRGCLKLMVCFTLVLFAVGIDMLLGLRFCVPLFVLYWICAREGISALENANKLGFPMPEWIRERLEQIGEIGAGGPKGTPPAPSQ